MNGIIYNQVRVPVIRGNGDLELLPYGLDEETGVVTLHPFQEAPEMDSHGIDGGEGFGQSSQEEPGHLPGHGSFKGFFHIILPFLILCHVHADASSMKQDRLPVSPVSENIQGAINQTRVGLHTPKLSLPLHPRQSNTSPSSSSPLLTDH